MEACQLNASLKGETVELWLFCESKPIFKASLWSSWMLKYSTKACQKNSNDDDLEIQGLYEEMMLRK